MQVDVQICGYVSDFCYFGFFNRMAFAKTYKSASKLCRDNDGVKTSHTMYSVTNPSLMLWSGMCRSYPIAFIDRNVFRKRISLGHPRRKQIVKTLQAVVIQAVCVTLLKDLHDPLVWQ